MNANSPNEATILAQALTYPSPEARLAYLQGACGGDEQLRARVHALIQAHEAAGGFLADQARADQPTMPMETPPAERAGSVIGRYKLLQQIGEGGCGVVYMAEQEEPVRRRVALKVIKLGMDTNSVIARFEAERQALALMDHPNIAKVLDAGATDTGRPYFVMELVRGIKITEYCDQNNLSTKERLGLFIQVCHAIQHAHQKGIIHRDIKPSNILVSMHDGVPVPVVIDFGIAKATEQRLTEKTLYTAFEQFIGTPAYTSPEQAEMSRLDIDTRSDIYSLGVLLYELLTGQTPFDAKELMSAGLEEMRRTIREKEPARPSTRLSTMREAELTTAARRHQSEAPKLINLLRGDLDWIVMKCLEKDRTRRYETATGLGQDIQRHLNNEPVAARPPSTTYRLQKVWRRNRLACTAGAAVTAALVVGIGISTWQAVVATRARADAEQARSKAVVAQEEAERAQLAESEARREAEAGKSEAAYNLYVANMHLAEQAWQQNNLRRLRQVLEDTKASPHRGFEWYYWQQQTHLAWKTLRGHPDFVRAVAFSLDGSRLVTGSNDAKVWEVETGRELFALEGHTDVVGAVSFSPDGQRIVTWGFDGMVKLWDAGTGREVITLGAPSMDPVVAVSFSADGQQIVTCRLKQTAEVWGTTDGRQLRKLGAPTGDFTCLAVSPHVEWLATDHADGTVALQEAESGRVLLTLKGHTGLVTSVAFSSDGQRIISGSVDRTARVWDTRNGRETLLLEGHTDAISSVSFSPDGQWILTCGGDGVAKLWNATTGVELTTLRGDSAGVSSAASSADGHRIVTGNSDGTVKVWDTATLLLPDEVPWSPLALSALSAAGGTFSCDGRQVLTLTENGRVTVLESTTGRELYSLEGHGGALLQLGSSPDGRWHYTTRKDKIARVWDGTTGRELLTLRGHTGDVTCLAFSDNGQRIATGSADKTAKVWEAATGRELLSLQGHTAGVSVVALSPSGNRLATSSDDHTVKVWDAVSGLELLTIKPPGKYFSTLAFSPDEQRIVIGDVGVTASVWEVTTGRQQSTLKGHGGSILSAGFSPDGRRIVTGSTDKTAKVWEATSGRELLTLKGLSGAVFYAYFSPDGHRIYTVAVGSVARLWEAARSEQVTAWQEEERIATESLAARERDQTDKRYRETVARDRDSIRTWLILGPIPLATSQSASDGLNIEQTEGEARLQPKAGETKAFGGDQLKWVPVDLVEPVIDFNAILGAQITQSVAYAVCYLRSEAPQHGLRMLVRNDGTRAKIYLNGNSVYAASQPVPWMRRSLPDITLNAGLNVLVFKTVKGPGGLDAWEGAISFTDDQGNPAKGIEVTLDAAARENAEAKQQ